MSESERGRESGEKAHSKFRQAARERAGEMVTFQTDDEDEGRTTN